MSVRLMPQLIGCANTRSNGQCYFVIILIFLFALFISGQKSLVNCYKPVRMK